MHQNRFLKNWCVVDVGCVGSICRDVRSGECNLEWTGTKTDSGALKQIFDKLMWNVSGVFAEMLGVEGTQNTIWNGHALKQIQVHRNRYF